jgi:hypothetical protein
MHNGSALLVNVLIQFDFEAFSPCSLILPNAQESTLVGEMAGRRIVQVFIIPQPPTPSRPSSP